MSTETVVNGTVHVGPDEEFRHFLASRTTKDGPVPFGFVQIGGMSVLPSSPAQCFVIIESFRALADHWQDELLLAAQMGDSYVLAPYETPASHRDELADGGIDREAC